MPANCRKLEVVLRVGCRRASYQISPARSVPGDPAQRRRDGIERAVRDPRVDVDAAVVVDRLEVVAHVSRLGILAHERIVVGLPRAFIERRASPLMFGVQTSAPISQSACSAVM